MAQVKDWVKVLIAAVLSTLVTLVITSAFTYPENINKKFDETNVKILNTETTCRTYSDQNLTKSKAYTDSKIIDHEKIHIEQKKQLDQMQDDLRIIKECLIKK